MKKILTLFALFVSVTLMAYDTQTDQQITGKIISSPGRNAEAAFDGDASTYFQASQADMRWVGMELEEPFVVTRIGFRPMNSTVGQDNMLLSVFEGANDPSFMDAVPLYLISEKPSKDRMTYVDINVSRGFRYVRYVGSAGSNCRVAELEFYGHPGVGDDSQFYQVTSLPTMSIHVADETVPQNRGEDFESNYVLIYDEGTVIQEYPVLTRVRGNYSATPDNKPYRVKFNDGKKHHMMKDGRNQSPTKAKKWVLLNSWRDKTLMRNPVGWEVSKRVNPTFTPWCQPVDLILNGDYRGTYVLADHVSTNPKRIPITDMEPGDTEGEALTGGYFFEADNNYGREPYHFMSKHGNTMSVHDPDEDVMQPVMFNYIRNYFERAEDILFGEDYRDPEKGYQSVWDLESFLKYFLISEFNGNTDMICQVFLYKERGDDLIYHGPVWDHDLALDNDATVYPGNSFEPWTYTVRQTGQWGNVVSRILSDGNALARLQSLWAELRDDSLFTRDDLGAMVDSLRRDMSASAQLNFIRWPYLNQYISLTPAIRGSWDAEVDVVKDYVAGRVAWMDKKLHYTSVDTIGGVYQIYTPRDLYKFSELVAKGKSTAKAQLCSDIDMSKYSDKYIPLGTTSRPFTGTIDGDGHTIDGLHLKGTDYVGLVAVAGDGCTLKNLTLGSGCTFEGDNYVASMVGTLRAGSLTLTGCGNEGAVSASGVHASGLVGFVRRTTVAKLTDCYNVGSVTANNRAAAIILPSAGRIFVVNAYNAGEITGVEDDHGFAYSDASSTFTNCYDVNASSQTIRVNKEEVTGGKLCVMLNAGRKAMPWRQNLDNGNRHDDFPVLNTRHAAVYEEDGIYTNLRQMMESYRYYRFEVTEIQSHGVIQFAEFCLLDENFKEMNDVEIYKGTDSNIHNESWPNVGDGNVGTKYCGTFYEPANFLFDAGDAVNIYGYRIYTANDTRDYPGRNPVSWRVYGSNTRTNDFEAATWELIDEREQDHTLGATNFTPYDFMVRRPKASIALDRHTLRLKADTLVQLQATMVPDIYAGARIAWHSTDEEVAQVDADGLVHTLAGGQVQIVATAPDYGMVADTCSLLVVDGTFGYRYYQLEVVATQGDTSIQLSEFDLLDDGDVEVPTLSVYDYQCEYFKEETPHLLVDNNTLTKYCGPATEPIYIYMDAGQTMLPVAYRMYTANDTRNYSGRNPLTWRLWGSADLSAKHDDACWKLLDEHVDDRTMKAVNFTPYTFPITYSFESNVDAPSSAPSNIDDAVYDLTGCRLSGKSLRSGIYIIGGKKVSVLRAK